MKKIVIVCDRCEREYKPRREQKEFILQGFCDPDYEPVDLCPECEKELASWMRESVCKGGKS